MTNISSLVSLESKIQLWFFITVFHVQISISPSIKHRIAIFHRAIKIDQKYINYKDQKFRNPKS